MNPLFRSEKILKFLDKEDRYIIAFNQTNGDLITGNTQRRATFDNFVSKNTLGSKNWIAK